MIEIPLAYQMQGYFESKDLTKTVLNQVAEQNNIRILYIYDSINAIRGIKLEDGSWLEYNNKTWEPKCEPKVVTKIGVGFGCYRIVLNSNCAFVVEEMTSIDSLGNENWTLIQSADESRFKHFTHHIIAGLITESQKHQNLNDDNCLSEETKK